MDITNKHCPIVDSKCKQDECTFFIKESYCDCEKRNDPTAYWGNCLYNINSMKRLKSQKFMERNFGDTRLLSYKSHGSNNFPGSMDICKECDSYIKTTNYICKSVNLVLKTEEEIFKNAVKK